MVSESLAQLEGFSYSISNFLQSFSGSRLGYLPTLNGFEIVRGCLSEGDSSRDTRKSDETHTLTQFDH